MPLFSAVNSFNAGELSPKMIGRTDVSQYARGCRWLRNFFSTPYGSAERRPGTLYVASVSDQVNPARLIPFIFSADVVYLCEVGFGSSGYVRFYRDDVLVDTITGVTFGADLSFVQSADVMFVVDGVHPVREIRRTAEDEFELVETEVAYPATLDDNLTDTTITPSAREGDITLAASAAIFEAGHVGSYWTIIHTRLENDIDHDFHADGVSDSLEVFGYWDLVTHGTWTGTLKIQRSFDNGATWKDYRTFTSANDNNVSTSGEEDKENVLYRLSMSDYVQATSGTIRYCQSVLSNPDYATTGVVHVTSVTSGTAAAGTVTKKLGDTVATREWNEPAWSDVRGYPRSIAFYEERLCFGGTAYQPQTIWCSRTNDWNNFKLGDLDDDAISFTLCSDTINHIRWMCQQDSLIIGTGDSEWTLSASNKGSALTPSDFRVRRQSVYGSGSVAARMAGEVVLFVQRQGRKVREFVYSWEKEGYTAPDLTALAEHITESGIVETALQQQPETMLWCRLADGTLAVLTYEREQQVVCWQKVETAGQVLSLAILPNGAGEDIIYLIASRTAEDVRVIERFAPREWAAGQIENAVYMDSAVRRTGTDITEITGLAHLAGETVQVFADGAEQAERVVSEAGTVTLDGPAQIAAAGLGYESLLSPMPIELDMQNGSSMLRRKTIAEIRVRVYDSVGGEVRAGEGDWQEMVSRSASGDDVNARIEPKDEVCLLTPRGGFSDEATIEIRQTAPLPLNVSSLSAILEICE